MFSPVDLLAAPRWPFLDLKATEAEGAILELQASLTGDPAVTSQELFRKDLLVRHRVAPAALNTEIAIPHARTNAVNDIVLALGRSQLGVNFGLEYSWVRLIVLIGTPKERASDYLRLLATVTRLLHPANTRKDLLAASGEMGFRAEFASALRSLIV